VTSRPQKGFERARGAAARYETPEGLRRTLGSPALFGIVQGFIAASVYFALGLVADRALGYTWIVLLVAALFFALLVLSYVEGASLHQEKGGATVIARFAFNELWSFVAGWAILLDYVILVAVCAFVTTDYAAEIWSPLGSGVGELVMAIGVILAVAALNLRGAGPRWYDRVAIVVLADLVLQVLIVVLGLALLLNPDVLSNPAGVAGTPSFSDLLFAFTLGIVAFSGLDASSGLAGQVHIGRKGLRRLISARVIAAVGPYVGIALVLVSAVPLSGMRGDERLLEQPVILVVESFDQAWLREPLRYVVAISAVAILFAACNAAMLGLSRLGRSLAVNRQIPSLIGRLSTERSTPVVMIGIGTLLAIGLVLPTDLEFLSGIYAFGATLAFTLVHLGLVVLRWREPERDRPYKMPFNVRVAGRELPLPAVLGFVMSATAFVAVVALHEGARIAGLGWMAFGIALYVIYRLSEDKPLFTRVTVPEQTLTRRVAPGAQYGSILVPVFGTPLDDDIMQTAGRLAAEEDLEPDDREGVVIEAIWVHEIPLSLPLDGRVPDAEIDRAKRALARAKAVGEEYDGVAVETHRVRGRSVGEAIVREARRKGVEAIVLAAEPPTRMRGGLLLGGQQGLFDTFVGETTRYVLNRAPCRVLLTAPPTAEGARGPRHPSPASRAR
jgi:APA family basic amino acid/polyamine antiporter